MTHYINKFKSWYQLYPHEFEVMKIHEKIISDIIDTNNRLIEQYNNLNSFAETLNQNAEVEEIKSKIQDNITRLTKINEDIRS